MARRPASARPSAGTAPDPADRQIVTALARGLDILRCFDARHRALGTTEIAQMTGLAQPTVWRLCHTLQKKGFLDPVAGKDKLQLGIAAIALGGAALAGQDALDIIRPRLQVLADQWQAAIALGRPDGDSVVYLLRCQGDSPLLMNLGVGSRIPLFHSAVGWAYFASFAPSERLAVQQQLQAGHKPLDAEEQVNIDAAINLYCERGFIFHERPRYQINTVAVAIELPGEERYLISCGGPASLLPQELMLAEVGPELVRLASELQSILAVSRTAGHVW
jgi:DNA-binding IclR family transcriptional regulator